MTNATAPDARKRELGLINMGKAFLARQAGMTSADYEPDYRALLLRVGGTSSAAALDGAGRDKVLRYMKAMGFKVQAKAGAVVRTSGRTGPQPLATPMHKKLRAMWYALADVGAVQRPASALACDDAVEAWAKRQLVGLDALRFARGSQMCKLVEELKAWGLRVQAQVD